MDDVERKIWAEVFWDEFKHSYFKERYELEKAVEIARDGAGSVLTELRAANKEDELSDDELFVTPGQTLVQLERVEQQLAKRFDLKTRDTQWLRLELINRDRKGELVEDETVSRWHELLALWGELGRVHVRSEE